MWEMMSLSGKETGRCEPLFCGIDALVTNVDVGPCSVRYEPLPEDPTSCACVSTAQFSPRPLNEGCEAIAIGAVVSMYDNTVGLHCKAVLTSLQEQAALLSTASAVLS